MSYADHINATARYAALTLGDPAPAPAERRAVALLQGDTAALLAEMTSAITGLRTQVRDLGDVADVARHPVRHMLKRLSVMPARAGYDDPTTSPMTRLAGRPASPAAACGPVQAWQGVVAELTQARGLLQAHAEQISDEERWAAVADVAVLAEALATARTDLLADQADTPGVHRHRAHAAALAVEAREVGRLAGAPGQPIGQGWLVPRNGAGVVTVSRVDDLPTATAHMTALMGSRACSISDLLAITRLTAQTSRACAHALVVAAAASPHPAREDLSVVAVTLDAHGDFLARAVAAQRTALSGPADPSGRLLTQARQLGAHALPRLKALTSNPTGALSVVPAILTYAASAPNLTRAIRDAVHHGATSARIAIHDRSDDSGNVWRPANTADLTPLLEDLTGAADFGTPPAEAITRARAAVGARTGGAARDLQVALERRRAELRPVRPAAAAMRTHAPTRVAEPRTAVRA